MHAEMDDGFAELGSPYYGEMDSREELYLVRLSWFTNKFTRRFRLYKLHGSIDRYWFGGGTAADLIKVKWGVSHMRLYREILLKGKLQYIDDNGNFYPDFLTGTTHKIEKYRLGKYYPAIFRHFERNLARSHTLIVIGYGFRDSRINEYIEKHFLDGTSKSVFVVDIAQPVWSPFSSKRVHFLGNGVSGMDTEFILKRLPRASKSA